MNVPDLFINKIIGAFGEDGRDWLGSLESRVQTCRQKWDLKIIGPVSNLSYNYVLKAVDSKGNPVILKLGVPNCEFRNEIRALEAYGGKGCGALIHSDPELGATVQEQLIPGTMLSEVDEIAAIHQFIRVWKAIRRPLPKGITFPTIDDWATGINIQRKLSR